MFGFERGNDWRQDDQMRWQFSMLQRHIYSVRTATRVFCVCPAHRPSHPTLQTSSTWPPLRGRRRTCVAVPVWDRTCKPFFGTCIVNKIHVIFTFLCVCTSFNPLLFNPLLQISYNSPCAGLAALCPSHPAVGYGEPLDWPPTYGPNRRFARWVGHWRLVTWGTYGHLVWWIG